MSDKAAALQRQLVAHLRATGALTQPGVAQAFLAVPRHLFLPGLPLDQVYADDAIATKYTDGQPISSSSQPAIMAIMLEQLAVAPGQNILEIGAGTGFNAALLGQLTGPRGKVVTVDLDIDLVLAARQHLEAAGAHNVQVVQADGGFGFASGAPYDRIILTVGAWDVAPAWYTQLVPGGRLVLPLELGQGPQQSLALDRPVDPSAEMWFESVSARDCGFMRLRGAMAGPEQTAPMDPQASLHLAYPGAPPAAPEAVYAWLLENSSETETGLLITERELWGGLAFWLGLQATNLCSLTEQLAPGQRRRLPCLIEFAGRSPTCFTLGLLGAAGLSVLCRPSHGRRGQADQYEREPFQLTLSAFGPEGQALSQDLLRQVYGWQAAGRPNADGLRVRVYPRHHPYAPASGEIVVAKRDTLLVLDWPAG